MHYKVEVLIKSDRVAEQLQMFLEGLLEAQRFHFKVEDLSVYEVTHFERG